MSMLGTAVPPVHRILVGDWTAMFQLFTKFALHGGRFGVSSLPLLFVSSSQGGPGATQPGPHFAPTISMMPLLLQSSLTPGSTMGLPPASTLAVWIATLPGLGSARLRS